MSSTNKQLFSAFTTLMGQLDESGVADCKKQTVMRPIMEAVASGKFNLDVYVAEDKLRVEQGRLRTQQDVVKSAEQRLLNLKGVSDAPDSPE